MNRPMSFEQNQNSSRPQYRGPTTEDEYAHRTPPHTFIYSFSRLLLTNASPPRATRQNRQPARSRGATNKTAYLPSKTVYDRQKLPTDRPPTAHAHSAPRKTAQKSATPVHRRPPPMRRRSTLTHIAGEGALSQPTSLLPARGEVHPRPPIGRGDRTFFDHNRPQHDLPTRGHTPRPRKGGVRVRCVRVPSTLRHP